MISQKVNVVAVYNNYLRFSAKKISSFTVSGLSLDLPCTSLPLVLKILSLGILVAHTQISTLVQVLTDLGKFSGVAATTVKEKTQQLITDKGGTFLILALLHLSMILFQQKMKFLRLVVRQIFFLM